MIPTKCTYDNTTTVGSLLYVISSFLSCLLFTILHYHVVFAVFPVSTVDAATNGCDSATSGNSTPFVATDVIIVGAGTAGISAYREIQRLEPSMKIILLEATDRIGGRVKLAKVGGYTVEQGANWLHGDGTEFRKLARKNSIQTSETKYLDMEVYDAQGSSIPLAFRSRVKNFISSKSPFYKMLKAAKQYWDETSSKYNGSEPIMEIMKSFGYTENDELDAFIRYIMIDYEYLSTDIALSNYYRPNQDLTTFYKTQSFVVDQRGFETVLHKFVADNNISAILNTKVTDIIYNDNSVLDSEYKVLVQATDAATSGTCQRYKAKRVIVTVPAAILHGNGYSINFQPPLNIEKLPYLTGQYNKVFYKFSRSFWDNRQFIGILRDPEYRGVCNHWQNVEYNIHGAHILMCTLTTEGMSKVVSLNLTASDLLQPLRVAYGANLVNKALQDTFFVRYDLDPATGYGAYSSFQAGYTLQQHYSFWGGYYGNTGSFVNGEGYNAAGEWIVHLGGSASCLEYYEYVDGAYFSGQRNARYVLRSLGSANVTATSPCDDF